MKKKKMTKVQVPMSLELKTVIDEKADEYGFSSTQELIRFVLTQVKNGSLKLTAVNTIPEIEISATAEKRLMKLLKEAEREMASGEATVVNTVEELMSELNS